MIGDISITEKSFGPKSLYKNLDFSIQDAEKIGVVGRNGVGKSTLLNILSGEDKDFTGELAFRRGVMTVSSRQEHHGFEDLTVLEYILGDLPEFTELTRIIETYPDTMGEDVHKITRYTDALNRFNDLGYYTVQDSIVEELRKFQIDETKAHGKLGSLSGGQKRLAEVVKIMHANAHLALIDEPTNHMDYIAKNQFISWMKGSKMAMLIITHDRDVLGQVDKIIEIKDGEAVIYNGNYDSYLKQNAHRTTTGLHTYEVTQRQIINVKDKIVQFRRLKERARDPDTIKQFKRREDQARAELVELEKIEKPTFWIDRESVENMDYKMEAKYQKHKTKNIRIGVEDKQSRSSHVIVELSKLSLGYTAPLFRDVSFQLREGERIELRGRNGAGKTTIIKSILSTAAYNAGAAPLVSLVSPDPLGANVQTVLPRSAAQAESASTNKTSGTAVASSMVSDGFGSVPKRDDTVWKLEASEPEENMDEVIATQPSITAFAGYIEIEKGLRIGVYEQEIETKYLHLSLSDAITQMYLDNELSISDQKVKQLLSDYLFDPNGDGRITISRLSGGQKARFQLIKMLSTNPQLLILDEPTNHLDLPSIEELENALERYHGAVLYVSHDSYFQKNIGGEVVMIAG